MGAHGARQLMIGDFVINDHSPCFVIAELGNNHQGDVDQAKQLIAEAHRCGAHSVKLQKRDNRSLFTKDFFNAVYNGDNSFGKTYGEHREFLEFGRDEYAELQTYAKSLGILLFATAFDIPSVDFLEDLDVPAYKVASGDLTNIPLLRHIASTGKPMIVSTGGAEMHDVARAHEAVVPLNERLCLLQCTAGYPPAWEELDLRVIETYRERFPETTVGFSSHDNGIAMAVVAYTLGARVLEKHFTLNRALKGTDHAFSLEPQGFRKLVRDLERTHAALGGGQKVKYASEYQPIYKMSKKIVAISDLPPHHVLEASDLALRSPGGGLPPYRIGDLVGRSLTRPISADEALDESHLGQ